MPALLRRLDAVVSTNDELLALALAGAPDGTAVAARTQTGGATVVLCTPSVIGEKKAGANPEDTMLEEYSAISRRVAGETGSTLCDLRKAFVDHIAKNNPDDADRGILTTDRVHLNPAGNAFVAAEILRVLDAR